MLRGQNTSCASQQKEAGVTPEARRDRAAIVRHDGVAPASGRVLAAFRFRAWSRALSRSFFGLGSRLTEPGGEISLEKFFPGTFHRHIYGPMRMSLE
jgi:hypothetical protein